MDIDTATRVFLRVAETESFSATAKQMGLGQPAVSKMISSLEDHLGSRLLQRTTRSLTLTEEGRTFAENARHAVEMMDHALDSVRETRGRITGLLRMATVSAFARLHVVPQLGAFMAQNPDLDIELVLHDEVPNLVEEGIDLHIHFGPVEEQGMVAKKIGDMPFGVYGAKSYLDRKGRPQTIADLANHDFIGFTARDMQRRWPFEKNGVIETLDINCRFKTNNCDTVREAALNGLGLVIAPDWLFFDCRHGGSMELLLNGYKTKNLPMYAVYPSRRYVPPKVRAAIDFLEEQYRKHRMLMEPDHTLLCSPLSR